MREFQRKRKIRHVLYSRGAILLLLVLLLLTGKAAWGVFEKERESRKALTEASASLTALETREKELKARIARLNTEEGIEAEIREQFPVTKPGEKMVVIVEEKGSGAPKVLVRESLIQKFFDLFR